MSFSNSIFRFASYLRRHGFWATMRRACLSIRRSVFSGRMVLFYCDFSALGFSSPDLPSSFRVERKRSKAEVDPQDLQRMTSFWNPKLAERNVEERMGLGASLWLIKSEGRLAGYGWTLQGGTVESHYFSLGAHDVHFFDFHVFPEFRGKGLNPLLVNQILHSLAAEHRGRVYRSCRMEPGAVVIVEENSV